MMKKGTMLAIACLCCLLAKAQTVFVHTYDYAQKGEQTLRMDVYEQAPSGDMKRPVLIFSYGGAWEGGKRADGKAILEHFAQKGYIAAGIDYRLGVREAKEKGVKIDSLNFASVYGKAIRMGMEDLFDATAYIISHADEWNADTSRIVICGSSAGAINSITAEYLLCNRHPMATRRLPETFNYAAVITCAGGIWLEKTPALQWKHKPCPVIAYHGTRDELVPYGKHVIGNAAFTAFGPDGYLQEVKDMGVSTLFHRYEGHSHVIAGIYLHEGARNEMLDFLFRTLYLNQRLNIDTMEQRPDKEPAVKTFDDTIQETLNN